MREMMLTARLIDAIEAKECGLVSEVHATSTELMKQADQIASRIADMAPLTLKATKIGLHRIRMTQKTDDSDLIEMCYMSDDFKHGIESFLSKSKPKWKGK